MIYDLQHEVHQPSAAYSGFTIAAKSDLDDIFTIFGSHRPAGGVIPKDIPFQSCVCVCVWID